MAKSVRASVSKRNSANLRKKVFGPVDAARTERLSAKLQELASQPKPDSGKSDENDDQMNTGMFNIRSRKCSCVACTHGCILDRRC